MERLQCWKMSNRIVMGQIVLASSVLAGTPAWAATEADAPQDATPIAVDSAAPSNSASTSSDLSLDEILNLTVETAARHKQDLSDAPSVISVLTRKDIEKLGPVTLIDALKYIPGIETSMGPLGEWRVAIRGERKAGNTLLLINGHPFNDFYDGAAVFDIPVGSIDRVELIRGPGSPLFGTNAVAGIINVFTVNRSSDAKLLIGTHTTGMASANYYDKVLGGDYSLSAGYLTSKGTDVSPYSSNPPTSLAAFDPTGLTNRWQHDYFFKGTYDRGGWSGSFFGFQHNTGSYLGPRNVVAPDSDNKNFQLIGDLSYKAEFSENFSITPKFYTNQVRHNFLTQETADGRTELGAPYSSFPDGLQQNEKYDANTYGLEIQSTYKRGEKLTFVTGALVERLKLSNYELSRNYKVSGLEYKGTFANWDDQAFPQNDKTRVVAGVYGEGDYVGSLFNTSLGFRFDKYSDFGSSFNPRGSVAFKPWDNFTLKLLYSQAFRAPTFKELYDATNYSRGLLGNTSLKPEVNRSLDLSAEFRHSRQIFRGTLFASWTKDAIEGYFAAGGGTPGVYVNLGSMRNTGYELESITLLTSNLSLNVNFSQFTRKFAWNTDVATASDVAYLANQGDGYMTNMPATRLNVGLDYNFWRFKTFGGLNYGGGAEALKRTVLEGQRTTQIPRYIQYNFRIGYDVTSKLFVSAEGFNIGTKYSDPHESVQIVAGGSEGMRQPGPTYLLKGTYQL